MKIPTILILGSALCALSASGNIPFTQGFNDISSVNGWEKSGGSESTSSFAWSGTEGNPPGALTFSVANVGGVGTEMPSDTFFTYTLNNVNFGSENVQVSFDGKLLSGLPGTAIHFRINDIFFGAIHGEFNDTSYTTFTRNVDANLINFDTDTLTIQFQFAMGPVLNAGGEFAVDNLTVIPEPSTYAALLGLLAIGFAFVRRRRRTS